MDSPASGTALVTKIRSPQMIGLEWPRPGISAFQRIFLPDSPFHSIGGEPVPTPLAPSPRNCGQFESAATAEAAKRSEVMEKSLIILVALLSLIRTLQRRAIP